MTVWTNVGYVSLFFLAGILAIPRAVHDAARTDGASSWQRFRYITLPMLRPTMYFVSVTGVVSAARCSTPCTPSPAAVRRAAPTLWRIASTPRHSAPQVWGRAAVMAAVLFVLLVGVTLVQHVYFRRRVSYDLT